MLDKNQTQNQQQSIDIAYEKHGIVSEFHCGYYTDERTEFFDREKQYGEGNESIKNRELYFKSRLVKGIIYEGCIKKLFCQHLDAVSKKCNSSRRNNSERKNCHIID